MKAFTYSSVLIKPQYSEIESRSKVLTTTHLGDLILDLPVISANMKTVTGPTMVKAMFENGGLGILHRFCSIEENVKMFNECCIENKIPVERVGISVGIRDEEYGRFVALINSGAQLICVDVAHGHHSRVKKMIQYINKYKKNNKFIRIVAGNVATPEAVYDLKCWGADIVKVGIGPGSACITRRNTGVGIPQLFALKTIREKHPKIPLIADGGIRTVGDIAKALKYSECVMIGAVLAGTIETPGKVYPNDNENLVNRTFYKIYGGSASAENKGENRFVEGKIQMIPFKGHVKYILKEIKEGLQSSFSYVGAKDLSEFQKKAKFIELDDSSRDESET